MTSEGCRAAFEAAPPIERAEWLDIAFPNCACEPWALTQTGGDGIPGPELVARILTSPDAYDETTSTVLTAKLTQIYAMGMSMIRQGASDDEIKSTVVDLTTNAAEPKSLIGAVVIRADWLRSYESNDDPDKIRWFGVYATDDRQKAHHGDVFGTSVSKGKQKRRRYQLASDMIPLVLRANTPDELIFELRTAGI